MKSFTLKVRDARIRRTPGHVLTGGIGRSVQAQALVQLLLRDGDARLLDRDAEGRAGVPIGDGDLLRSGAGHIDVGREAAGDGLRFARRVGIAGGQTGGVQLVTDIIGRLVRTAGYGQGRLSGRLVRLRIPCRFFGRICRLLRGSAADAQLRRACAGDIIIVRIAVAGEVEIRDAARSGRAVIHLLDGVLDPGCLQRGLRVVLRGVLVEALHFYIAVGIEHPHGTLLDLSRIERGHECAALRNAGQHTVVRDGRDARVRGDPIDRGRFDVPELLVERERLANLQNDASRHFQRLVVMDGHVAGGCLAADHDGDCRRAGRKRFDKATLVNCDRGRIAGRPDNGGGASAVLQRICQIKRLADLKIELRLELIDRDVGLRRLAGAVGADIQTDLCAGRSLTAAERRLRRDMAGRDIAARDGLRRGAEAALRQQPLCLSLLLVQDVRHKLLLRAEADDKIDAAALQDFFAEYRGLLDDAAARNGRMVAQLALDAVERHRAQIGLGRVKRLADVIADRHVGILGRDQLTDVDRAAGAARTAAVRRCCGNWRDRGLRGLRDADRNIGAGGQRRTGCHALADDGSGHFVVARDIFPVDLHVRKAHPRQVILRSVLEHGTHVVHDAHGAFLAEAGRREQVGRGRKLRAGVRILRQNAALFDARVIIRAFHDQMQRGVFRRRHRVDDLHIHHVRTQNIRAVLCCCVGLRLAVEIEQNAARGDCGCQHARGDLCPERPAEAAALADRLLDAPDRRLRGQLLIKLGDALRAVLRMQRHAVEDRRILRLRNGLVEFGRRRQHIALVLLQIFSALDRAGRRDAGDHLIERRAERIDVGGGTLYAVAVILLLGRIAVLDDHGHALAAVVDRVARSAEVDQTDAAVLQEHDVVRCNIPVDHPAVMYTLQRQHDRREHTDSLFRRDPSLRRNGGFLFQILAQRDAVEIFHHEISRFVCGEAVVDVDDAVLVLECGQALGLVQKFFLAELEVFALLA